MSNCDKLISICEICKKNIEKSFSSSRADRLSICLVYLEDLNKWINCCKDFEKMHLVKEAQDECYKSIVLCTQGLYKEAFSTLRQFLEHMLFSILLSTCDYNYRLWLNGKYDMSWAGLMDEQKGVFGKDFIRVYGKDLDEDRSIELIHATRNVYRECSEFVHGNYGKLISLSSNIDFNEDLFNRFIEFFYSIKYIVSMALFIRFRDALDDKGNLRVLEPIIMDSIGELPEVQYLYAMEDL